MGSIEYPGCTVVACGCDLAAITTKRNDPDYALVREPSHLPVRSYFEDARRVIIAGRSYPLSIGTERYGINGILMSQMPKFPSIRRRKYSKIVVIASGGNLLAIRA